MTMANTINDLNTGTPPIDMDIHTPEIKPTSSIHGDFYINNILLEDIN